MKTKVLMALFVAALMAAIPITMAQEQIPTVQEPVETTCKEEMENCDPQAANQAAGRPATITPADNMPVRTILYAHFKDLLQRAPLNTQYPDPNEEESLDQGFLMPTIYTENEAAPCCKFRNNEFLMFSSPGFVEYLAEGQWRVHQEPGLAEQVDIVGIDGNFMWLYWYMSPESAPDAVPGDHVGVMPAVGVYAQMNIGRHPTDDSRLMIASGDTGSGYKEATPYAEQCAECVSLISQPGAPTGPIYQFKVPMTLHKNFLPSVYDPAFPDQKGYIVQVIPYQIQTDQARFTQADWRLVTGPDYPPRVVMDVQNPMQTTSTRVHTFDDFLFFRWSFKSVWGSYDVEANSLELTVEGPKTLGPGDLEFVKLKFSVDHDGHFKPVNATWRYDYVNNPLPAGTYTVKGQVKNHQSTYLLDWEEQFTVDDKGIPDVEDLGGGFGGGSGGRAAGGAGGDSPGFQAVGLIAAIGAAAAILAVGRRRVE